MDILDILEGKYYKTHSGTYYKKLPETARFDTPESLYKSEVGVWFDYEIIDPSSWQYRNLLGNLIERDASFTTIKTCEALDFRAGEFIVADTCKLYQIYSVTEDTSAASREAARLLPIPIGTEYLLRLVEVENPRQIV